MLNAHFSHACFRGWGFDLFSFADLRICGFADEDEARADDRRRRVGYGEAFWPAYHEAWQRSDLNQGEYFERHGIPLKAFGNWRVRFKAEPQEPVRKLLYRRGGLSHSLSHMTYLTTALVPLIVCRDARATSGASTSFGSWLGRSRLDHQSEVARYYDIDRCIPCRWKQDLEQTAMPGASVAARKSKRL